MNGQLFCRLQLKDILRRGVEGVEECIFGEVGEFGLDGWGVDVVALRYVVGLLDAEGLRYLRGFCPGCDERGMQWTSR
jgi:hypothetical protein